MAQQTKFVFVTGGVVSSLGKGMVSASIGALMENRGLKVANMKLDPYINVDPGTMNPTQHGEVFVTDDGAETDLDLGHYERFVSTKLSKLNNKLDLASITIGGHVIPIFKPGDHERIDRYMGIEGIAHSENLNDIFTQIPGVTFYDNATIFLDDNVEFDKQKFAAYFDGDLL